MKLPEIPFLKKKSEVEYILVLLLRQEKANAVVIAKQGDIIRVLNQHEEYFSTNLEDAKDEEWLDITDAAITRAEELLPPSIETHKTIFGLPNSWVEEKQIKKEYLAKLKYASDELDLKPVGFIEIPEAIIHSLGEDEGAPVSAILAEVGKRFVVLTLSRGGRIIDTKSAPIRSSSLETVDTLLKEFEVDVLPSRLIIYNGQGGKELAHEFTSHHWSKSIPFLHPPQVTILDKGFDTDAVIEGAAGQLGATLSHTKAQKVTLATALDTADEERESEHTTAETTAVAGGSASDFGFTVDGEEETPELKTNETSGVKEAPLEETVSENGPKINDPYARNDGDEVHRNLREPDPLEIEEPVHTTPRKNPLSNLKLPAFLQNLSGKLPENMPKNKFMLLIPIILIIFIVGAVSYATMLKATVEVTVRPEVAEETQDVIFTTSGSNDFSDNTLAVKTTTVEVTGTASTKATGEKEEGEKAKGTVTIFNSSTSKKELAQGTVISSSNNLDFVLDKEVIIASASGDIFSGIKSGTAKVPVTASEIGKESNIPSNTTFKIGSDSSLGAKNDEAFSGGSKEEILVVSASDLAKLAKDLPESLTKKAEDQINQKLGGKEILLTVYTDFKPAAGDYSAKAGEEAQNVTLDSTVEFTGVFYENSDLIEFTKALMQEKFSEDLELDEKNIKTTISDIKEDDGEYSATLDLQANLLPKMDNSSLKEKIKGKSFGQAAKIIEDLPQVISTKFVVFPPLPFLNMLPRQAENIDIIVISND